MLYAFLQDILAFLELVKQLLTSFTGLQRRTVTRYSRHLFKLGNLCYDALHLEVLFLFLKRTISTSKDGSVG